MGPISKLAILFISTICGTGCAFGFAFLVMSIILDKSNNFGDNRSKEEDFSSEILYHSQVNRLPLLSAEYQAYPDNNLSEIVRGRDFREYSAHAMKGDPEALVTRYIPGEENDDDASSGQAFVPLASLDAAQGQAPTASRPLWESTNTNDDFSDFEDQM